jgi:hypothetical protein
LGGRLALAVGDMPTATTATTDTNSVNIRLESMIVLPIVGDDASLAPPWSEFAQVRSRLSPHRV